MRENYSPLEVAGSHHERRLVWSVLLLILIIAAGYLYWRGEQSSGTAPATTNMSDTNAAKASALGLPSGFPTDTPVELANLTESYTVPYPDHGVTQYSASYTSVKSTDTLWKTYTNYLAAQGYTLTDVTNKSDGVLNATKGATTFNAVISTVNSRSLVQITYLVKE